NYVKQYNWKIKGVEVDDAARKIATDSYQLDVVSPQEMKNIPNASLDTITLWHVLEHLYNVENYIQEFKRVLTDDGTLFIAVPNASSYDAQKYKAYWSAYDLPIHLYHFTPKDIKALFTKNGFELVEMKPMYFDAFWISLESEKY